jgi:hypothetical protein
MRHLLPLALCLLGCQQGAGADKDTDLDPIDTDGAFMEVQSILTGSCATSGCHDGTQSPDMRSPAYDHLVGVWANGVTLPYVDPEYTDTSYLMRKITGTQEAVGGVGAPMPFNGDPLPEPDIERIASWILDGAPR